MTRNMEARLPIAVRRFHRRFPHFDSWKIGNICKRFRSARQEFRCIFLYILATRTRGGGDLWNRRSIIAFGRSGKRAGAARRGGPCRDNTQSGEDPGPPLAACLNPNWIVRMGRLTTGPSLAPWHQECDRQSGIVPFSRSLRVEPPTTRSDVLPVAPVHLVYA